jgi:hypothetical protein
VEHDERNRLTKWASYRLMTERVPLF